MTSTSPSSDWLFEHAVTIAGLLFLGVFGRGILRLVFDDQGDINIGPWHHIGASLGAVVFYTSLLTAFLYVIVVGVSFALDERGIE